MAEQNLTQPATKGTAPAREISQSEKEQIASDKAVAAAKQNARTEASRDPMQAGIDKARAAYEALAKQSAHADSAANGQEVARIKPLKMAAFAEVTRLETEQRRAQKEVVRNQHGWKPA